MKENKREQERARRMRSEGVKEGSKHKEPRSTRSTRSTRGLRLKSK